MGQFLLFIMRKCNAMNCKKVKWKSNSCYSHDVARGTVVYFSTTQMTLVWILGPID